MKFPLILPRLLVGYVKCARSASVRSYACSILIQEGHYGKLPTPHMDITEDFQCLRHSNWTIFSPLSYFCFQIFTSFSLSYWEANSYYPRGPILGKGQFLNSKTGWDRGFPVPGAFKLDHLQPIKPLLLPNFYKFFTFILVGQFLLPQMANNGERGFSQLQKWMKQGVFSALGIQIGPFASL